MSDSDSIQQRIISSVFNRRNASGGSEEAYVSHVKIWEDTGPETDLKPRYILLARNTDGGGFIHKSKLNSNGTFSVGKTWKLNELRAVEVVNPLAFNITLARTYRWQTERPNEQLAFLHALLDLFRTVSNGSLQVIGLPEPETRSASRLLSEASSSRESRTPTPPVGALRASESRRPRNTSSQDLRDYEDPPSNYSSVPGARAPSSSRKRPSPISSRPPSPLYSSTPTISSAQPRQPSQPSSSTVRPPRAIRPSPVFSVSGASDLPSTQLPSPSRLSTATALSDTRNSANPDNLSVSVSRPSLDVPSPATSINQSAVFPTSSDSRRSPSPALSSLSKAKFKAQPRGPSIPLEQPPLRRDQNARISFFDTANQSALDRLIFRGSGISDPEDIMASVEEMLEGYEWASDDILGRTRSKGAVDQIAARLLDELMALEKANIHSFIETDDRVTLVLKFLDEAILELDNMESLVSSYKIHLNAVNDDISFIQSQNRGLQVQTQNQHALLNELEQLLQTVQVGREALITLTQGSLRDAEGIHTLEEAATGLYKALQAGRDRDMAATMERLEEYRTHNAQFCKRLYDYLCIMFTAQSTLLLGDSSGLLKHSGRSGLEIKSHKNLEGYLDRYSGLILYMKEMDEVTYGKLCAAYFSEASRLHSTQITSLLSLNTGSIRRPQEDDPEYSFSPSPTVSTSRTPGALRRAGTVVRSPLDGRKEKEKASDGDMTVQEVFRQALEQISRQVYREEEFIADFLQINEAGLTFADYMGLDNYFRRQAARTSGLSAQTNKLVRGAMDLIFGFLPLEMKSWIDRALAKDSIQIIGILSSLERFLADADERGKVFLVNLLDKQHTRLKGLFERHVAEQIKAIEETKLTSRKRNGVAHFVKYFPVYVGRVESQLIGADTLEIRQRVDSAYDRIVQSMFDSLKHMAKMDGEEEDKGQLNYHVILVENMHYFVAEIRQQEIGSVNVFATRAEVVYEENLNAYVKIVLRRPFAKIIDYFDGVEQLLKTTAASEVSSNSSYSRSALKKVVKEYDGKDIRKHVDVLFKRVEKHFTEASEVTAGESSGITPGTVMVGVWKASEEELLRITEIFAKLISQCYANSGVSLEYSVGDVEAAFRRHRIGS
ncbi:exocyst complex component Sec3-domain-containing protein [Multifurca ochricompacta]|uniref:Exocyst complex component Sec3-domain-containing protein n=1 Tax=Multifurca ochricompacta TaxID=376703 RepID=A0AAD4QTQ1_9AGAM|nr:exocyst complex component Sec3-domain-containing protein [Multifurca ochricompacta]